MISIPNDDKSDLVWSGEIRFFSEDNKWKIRTKPFNYFKWLKDFPDKPVDNKFGYVVCTGAEDTIIILSRDLDKINDIHRLIDASHEISQKLTV